MELNSSLLTRAAADGDAETVRALLAEGADVNSQTGGGQTALILAIIGGHERVVEILCSAGADAHMQDRLGLTAFDWAERRGFHDFAKLFETQPQSTTPTERPTRTIEAEIPHLPEDKTRKATTPEEKSQRWLAGVKQRWKEEEARQQQSVASTKLHTQPTTPPRRGETSAQVFETSQQSEPESKPPIPREPAPEVLTIPKTSEQIPAPTPVEEPVQELFGTPEPNEQPTTTTQAEKLAREGFANSQPGEPQTSRAGLDQFVPKVPAGQRSVETFQTNKAAQPVSQRERKTEGQPSSKPSPPPFLTPPASTSKRATLWILILITLVASAVITHYLIRYFSSPTPTTQTAVAQPTPEPIEAKETGPVLSEELAGKQLNVPEPDYPLNAKTKGVGGIVVVRIRVNRRGRVVAARSSGGDGRLRRAAVEAATNTTFDPSKLPTRGLQGTITYTFKP